LLRHLRRHTYTGVEDLGWRGRSTPSSNLKKAVNDGSSKCRALVEDEGEKADEHDPPDKFCKPAIERSSLDRQPHSSNADLDCGKDPEQGPRRVHDGGLPSLCSRGDLIFQLSQDLALLCECWTCKQRADQSSNHKRPFKVAYYHRGRISWP